ncbi:MAG: hypothetical protein HBSIN02_04450 [Bacteroidia bacterium]|nr:MAG: hypothetical protein HBSIN02_04450 [Bacteroidia bacterium]
MPWGLDYKEVRTEMKEERECRNKEEGTKCRKTDPVTRAGRPVVRYVREFIPNDFVLRELQVSSDGRGWGSPPPGLPTP